MLLIDGFDVAESVLLFLKEIEDVYERARLAQSIVIVGEGASVPGFTERLIAEVNSLARKKAMIGKERDFVKHVESPFAPSCLLWVGCAVLVETGDIEIEDSDVIKDRISNPSPL